jgi:hypothetical protein
MNARGGTRTMVAALALSLLAACGAGITGTWEDEMGLSRLTFQRGGKVVQSSMLAGVEMEMSYEVDGDTIRLRNPEAAGTALVLTRLDQDTLYGPMGLRFRRRD